MSFADLWTRNVSKLSEAFPSDKEEFDESRADLALAGKLAWLTGNDCPRIEKLMKQSFLARDKYERKDYLCERTIPRALKQDGEFWDPKYKEKKQQEAERRREQIEENIRIGEDSEDHPSSRVLTEDEMQQGNQLVRAGFKIQMTKGSKRSGTSSEPEAQSVPEQARRAIISGAIRTGILELGGAYFFKPSKDTGDLHVSAAQGAKHGHLL